MIHLLHNLTLIEFCASGTRESSDPVQLFGRFTHVRSQHVPRAPRPPDHVQSDSGHPRRHPYTHLTMQKSDELLEANDTYDHKKTRPVSNQNTNLALKSRVHGPQPILCFCDLLASSRKTIQVFLCKPRATWKEVGKHLRLIMVCVSLTSQSVVEATFKFGFGGRERTMCRLHLR